MPMLTVKGGFPLRSGLCGRRESQGQAGEGGRGQQEGLAGQGGGAAGRGSGFATGSGRPCRRVFGATASLCTEQNIPQADGHERFHHVQARCPACVVEASVSSRTGFAAGCDPKRGRQAKLLGRHGVFCAETKRVAEEKETAARERKAAADKAAEEARSAAAEQAAEGQASAPEAAPEGGVGDAAAQATPEVIIVVMQICLSFHVDMASCLHTHDGVAVQTLHGSAATLPQL